MNIDKADMNSLPLGYITMPSLFGVPDTHGVGYPYRFER